MLLGRLIEGLGVTLADPARASVRICDVTEDSRTVMPGSLFIAREGAKADGRRFIGQALATGAAAILTDPSVVPPARLGDAAWLTTRDIPTAEARIAERFYGDPSRHLTVVGITGTNGKTTIAHLVYQLLNAAKVRCGLIGTVTVDDGAGVAPSAMTTPPALELSYALSKMVEARYSAAALEVSSHALDQGRVSALGFDVAVFSNISGDHLDYHGTMERYIAAKALLFASLKPEATAVINIEDPAAPRMIGPCRGKVLRCSLGRPADGGSPGASWGESGGATPHAMPVTLHGPWGKVEGVVPLIGRHNVMNCLQAVAAAHAAGAPTEAIERALPTLAAPPGRLELVMRRPGRPEDFSVFVDYAHSDDSLAKALQALRPLLGRSARLRVVFGCGGDKDRTKRPRMGRVAAELADDLIVTSDNPRTESPGAIIKEVLGGIDGRSGATLHVEPDRREAIRRAVQDAGPGDILLIAGKGHEDYQLVPDGQGGIKRLEFDDRVAAREALRERMRSGRSEDPPMPETVLRTPRERLQP